MRKRFWKGLRAIEIGIVVAVITIILTVVVARYPDFKCRSMQSEAKFSLQEIYAAQMHFFSEHSHYATAERLLLKDGRVRLSQKYYSFNDLFPPTKDGFTIAANGLDNTMVAGEIWTVDQNRDIKIIKAVCAKD